MRQSLYEYDDIFMKKTAQLEKVQRLGIDIFNDKKRVQEKAEEGAASVGIPYRSIEVEDCRAQTHLYRVKIEFSKKSGDGIVVDIRDDMKIGNIAFAVKAAIDERGDLHNEQTEELRKTIDKVKDAGLAEEILDACMKYAARIEQRGYQRGLQDGSNISD